MMVVMPLPEAHAYERQELRSWYKSRGSSYADYIPGTGYCNHIHYVRASCGTRIAEPRAVAYKSRGSSHADYIYIPGTGY